MLCWYLVVVFGVLPCVCCSCFCVFSLLLLFLLWLFVLLNVLFVLEDLIIFSVWVFVCFGNAGFVVHIIIANIVELQSGPVLSTLPPKIVALARVFVFFGCPKKLHFWAWPCETPIGIVFSGSPRRVQKWSFKSNTHDQVKVTLMSNCWVQTWLLKLDTTEALNWPPVWPAKCYFLTF